MAKTLLLSITFLLCLSLSVFAGTAGKITGKVTDAENDQPLPGVNVVVEGTSFGAATNLRGHYVILNIPPGIYSLKFKMIGYTEYFVKNVRVIIDLTTNINAQLNSEVLTGEEVVIIAQRPVVTKDVSNSQMNIEARRIESMPVQTVKQVLSLQAGIESDRAFMKVLIIVIVIVVILGITGAQLTAILERRHELAILAALGMKGRQVLGLIVIEAFMIGLGGTVIALLIGGGAAYQIATKGVDLSVFMGDDFSFGNILCNGN